MDKEKSGSGAYIVLDSDLAIRTTIPVSPQNDLALDDLGTGVEVTTHPYYRTIINDQTLITVTVPYPKKANKLVAYNLTTGQRHAYRFVWADNRIYGVRSKHVPVTPSLYVLG
jgi:hypothetical protein